MKKSSRKRLLVSSVAMLLVAMLALGTATYAWFSTNTKATADGLTAKTSQSSNIMLSENGSDWTDTLHFATKATGNMTPVTTADFTSFVTTQADGLNKGIKGDANTYADATANSDYTATDLYVKYDSADASATKKIKIDLKTANNAAEGGTENFLRVALVPTGTATTALVTSNVIYGNAKDDFAKNREKFTALDAENTAGAYSLVTTESKNKLVSMTLTANTEYHFGVYVWYEGTDPQCIDANSLNDYGISFEVSEDK